MAKTLLALYNLAPMGLEPLERHFNVVKLWQEDDPEATIMRHREDAVAIVSWPSNLRVSRKIIEALPNLEIIAQFGVGYDNIDVQAAKERGVVVCNTPDLVTNDTADTALGLMLNVSRRFVEADAYVRVGKWATHGSHNFLSHRLGGKTVGIVGLGRIGQAIARRAEAFGCNIHYTARSKKDVPYTYESDLKKLAEESDFLVLSCSATPETKGMVTLDILKALGPHGYLINVARGSIVNEDDLLIALANKAIAGAGLDVFAEEPHVPDALKTMDNVVLLPHIGTATYETRTEMGQLVVANILGWFEHGETLTRVV
ncbi:MAG: 2-hydroxyacid dehydrogenase [Rhodospirillales bacterium]|nr:2-hydroxyacid dehydrogenase [Rhodospirillales bacterium]MCB9965008.1 2-hydroxyacid dehydrogenase [Rhodospirillales bacterium]MCB9973400.1 2-hydroxyacid dehydrogenase [Rhodospirillales bacterium]MCB9980403.1 2-hydroxyacid dehydrogenase [Rhodospirillales bacterium]